MRYMPLIALLFLYDALPSVATHVQHDRTSGSNSGYEVIVFEADGCTYCQVLRRRALPHYKASRVSQIAPMRFVNVSTADLTGLGISSRIAMAPTVVLMRDGREVNRINGYAGADAIVRLVVDAVGALRD